MRLHAPTSSEGELACPKAHMHVYMSDMTEKRSPTPMAAGALFPGPVVTLLGQPWL